MAPDVSKATDSAPLHPRDGFAACRAWNATKAIEISICQEYGNCT